MNQIPNPAQWRPLKITGFADLIGPILTSAEGDGPTVYGLQTEQKHANMLNCVHGGVLAAFLDQVIAIAAWKAAERAPTVTVQMDTWFLGAAKLGEFLQAHAHVDHMTRSMIFVSGRILGETGPVACAKAVMKISKQAGTA